MGKGELNGERRSETARPPQVMVRGAWPVLLRCHSEEPDGKLQQLERTVGPFSVEQE